jgi:mutator protein MutT
MNDIKIAAALIIDAQQRLLLVRKHNTQYFMQPGGKIDDNESPADCLIRELREELNINVERDDLQTTGSFHAVAANEPDHLVTAELFLLRKSFDAAPAAEIAEAVWVSLQDKNQYPLAPLTRDHVFPLAEKIFDIA